MAGYGQPYGQYPGAPPQGAPAYGAPPPQPGYGAPPQPGYGAPPQPGYGAPPQPGYGAPPGAPQGGAPPPGGYYPPQHQHPYGGPPPQVMPPGPPQQDPMFLHFQQVAGADQKISAQELQELLKKIGLGDYPRPGWQELHAIVTTNQNGARAPLPARYGVQLSQPGFCFQAETCRQMIAMLDVSFRTLYQAIDAWKLAFQRHDTDRSGSIEHHELSACIREMGFNMTPAAVNVAVKRYSFKGNDQVAFDDFVACAIRIRALSNAFRGKDAQGRGFVQNISYDDFMQMVLKL